MLQNLLPHKSRLGSRPALFGAVALFFIAAGILRAELSDNLPIATRVLTNSGEMWSIPDNQRNQLFRIQTEMLVYYYDPEWNAAWGECQGQPLYLPIADSPMRFSPGQRIRIDGLLLPAQQRFIWDRTRVEILETNVILKPVLAAGLNENSQALRTKLISIEGLVDKQSDEDPIHLTFNFLAGDTSATVHVYKGTNNVSPPRLKEGDFVRINCVYSPQIDLNGKITRRELWVPALSDVRVVGSLDSDPRFDRPVVASEKIQYDTPTTELFHVRGIVRSHEPGKWVTLWDETGQILVESSQIKPLRFGDRVEAVGYPFLHGVKQCLKDGVYRLAASNSAPTLDFSERSPLCLAEQVRDLSREAARKNPEVVLRGILTWSREDNLFTYIQDASGGIQVAKPKWIGSGHAGSIVVVRGQAAEGDFIPVVTNAVISSTGWWNIDDVHTVTLEQAMTGLEVGRWVEMRGYVRLVLKEGPLTCLELSTSSGEFKVLTPTVQTNDHLKGAIIRVQGVCDAVTDLKHRLVGIQVLSPEAQYLTVEEPAPDDLFAVPLRTMESLRRFNPQNALNQRVRVVGTVVLHAPGRHLYLQDGDESVFALSQQSGELRPGDQVEVVGLAGTEGRRFLLREAAFRRLSKGPEPAPVQLSATHSLNKDFENLLVRADGTLLNSVNKDGDTHLLIHSRDSAFEATLPGAASQATNALPKFEVGSKLALTGVYEIQTDDYGRPASFVLQLRSWNDIKLLERPPWWTTGKLLWLVLGSTGVAVVGLFWGMGISRNNKSLKRMQADLQTANDDLELRVQERTQELEQQVVSKERARAALAEAQKNLILTSRKAGMAEVATGILHNVGNVLNSVNVSVSLLTERIRRYRVENVVSAASLLQRQPSDLAEFLLKDPKGVQLPAYLQRLGEHLIAEKRHLGDEIGSLAKSVDHIKVIVAMQQDYAKVGGVFEKLNLEEVVEDAIRINSATPEHDPIQLTRDYQPLPRVVLDRHKVLQILINLLSNAKHALEQKASDKKIIVRLALCENDRVRVSIVDNGIGIAAEHVQNIFSSGFTTRKEGHGYGLHNAANAAKELGGSLNVKSDGPGHGASFTLELPAAGIGVLPSN